MDTPVGIGADIANAIKTELTNTNWVGIAKDVYQKVKAVIITIITVMVLGFVVLLAFLIAILVIAVQINDKVQ